jgi:hypothetical protein
MPDFFEKITEMQGGLEDLIRKLPGFKGYLEKQDRRAADKLLREHLVRVFEEQLNEFTRLQNRLVDEGGIMHMERVQRITTLLQTFIDRIETAARGYGGVFDAIKVKEDELARLYAFDNTLLVYQEQLVAGLQQFAETMGTDEFPGVLTQLEDLVSEANDTFRRRVEAIQGLSQ